MLGLRTLNAILAVPATNLDSLRLYLSELIKDHRAIQNRPELTSAPELSEHGRPECYLADPVLRFWNYTEDLAGHRACRIFRDVYRDVLRGHKEQTAIHRLTFQSGLNISKITLRTRYLG